MPCECMEMCERAGCNSDGDEISVTDNNEFREALRLHKIGSGDENEPGRAREEGNGVDRQSIERMRGRGGARKHATLKLAVKFPDSR